MKIASVKAGFSLIELMIAVGVLAIGVLMTITVILSSISLDRQTRELTLAKNAAQLRMQHYRALNFNDLRASVLAASGTLTETFPVTGLRPIVANTNAGDATITNVDPDAARANLMNITVRVRWAGSKGGNRDFQLQGQISDRGLRFTPAGP